MTVGYPSKNHYSHPLCGRSIVHILFLYLDVVYFREGRFLPIKLRGETLLVSSRYVSVCFAVLGLEMTVLSSRTLWGDQGMQ